MLLISRQVIGNLKESALPYMLEHLKFAKMSFDLWGALSPTTSAKPPLGEPEREGAPSVENTVQEEVTAKRSMSQAELESSLYKVQDVL